ncbi:MAG: neutral/alkaline non-lysosomal ceramidase N-terminal domain-containing protein [Planctomycetota bacterium]|nr:neutral/alkaline non-lysosomal ceramidase N-terminal domain-containing protein [Planctomycetota bacterium]
MNCVLSWNRRGKHSCGTDGVRYRSSPLLLLVLLAGLQSCTGLFHRTRPAQAAHCVHIETGPISVGFAEADITPPGEVYLAGFNLARRSTGVHSSLAARVMVLECGGRNFVIVGLDSLGLQRDDAEWIKSALVGIANGDVFLCSSHTHAGPDPVGMWGWYFLTSGREVSYISFVRRRIAEAVSQAKSRLRPAALSLGTVRLPREGIVKNSNRPGVFNRRVTVLAAKDRENGQPLGALLHLACHPEMMRRRNTLVSSDMVGALCDQWRGAGHGQAVFVNGELGAMVSPGFHPRGVDGMPLVGKRLLSLCERALATSRPLAGDRIEVRRRDVYMPLETPGLSLGRLTGAIRRELYSGCIRASVGYLAIGDFEAVCVPGEMEPVLASEIRLALRKPNLLVFGLVDDEVGYLMRGQDSRDPEFSYERTMSPNRDAGEQIRRALTR